MRNAKKLGVCAALALVVAAVPAAADPLVLNSGWNSFTFGDVGSSFSQTFDFTLSGTATFNVTDAYLDGDQFDIFINGIDQGLTSTPTNDGTFIGDDYDAAFASPLFSHASYVLGPGTYSVSGTVAASPYTGGGAAAELVGSVPEPASWALMLTGFGAAGAMLRRKRTTATISVA